MSECGCYMRLKKGNNYFFDQYNSCAINRIIPQNTKVYGTNDVVFGIEVNYDKHICIASFCPFHGSSNRVFFSYFCGYFSTVDYIKLSTTESSNPTKP